ncbi:MAG: DUF342 domain-containing protein [Chitinophagales bacterium]
MQPNSLPFFINISPSKMEAYLTLNVPEGQPIDADDVLLELNSLGIIHGIDLKRILELCAYGQCFRELIAVGTPPIDGKDAVIHYSYIRPSVEPQFTSTGHADYRNLTFTISVSKYDVIAKRDPATNGENGTNIFGESVPAKVGKPKTFLVGKGVTVTGELAVAAFDGALQWVGDRVSVAKLHTVKKDVDFSTGNINFNGKVVVMGSVKPGFRVEATDDIEICGEIEGAESVVSRKGSVYVRRGIIGQNKTVIWAAENVKAGFVQDAVINAGEDIVIADYIMRTLLTAGQSIYIYGSRGRVLGENTLKAGISLKVNQIQSNKSTLTVDGFSREKFQERILEIGQELESKTLALQKVASQVRNFEEQSDAYSMKRLKEILPGYFRAMDLVASLEKERKMLKKALRVIKGEGMIEICGEAIHGLIGSIKDKQIAWPQSLKQTVLYYDTDSKDIQNK